MRRIGVLMNLAEDDPEAPARRATFQHALRQLGWTDGGNVRIDYRWGADDAGRLRRYAAELVALAPDVILATGTPSVAALQQATHTVPMVFVTGADPVGDGFVKSLARPGLNATGFLMFPSSPSARNGWSCSRRSRQASPGGGDRDAGNAGGIGQFGAINAVAPSFRVEMPRRSTCATPMRSTMMSRPSLALRTAV